MEKTYTVSVFTENSIGMMNRVTIVFTRRHLNIDSITASESEVPGVFRYTIVLRTTRQQVDKVVGQLEKVIDVIKAFVHEENDIVHQEVALYKIRTETLTNGDVEKVIREHHARVLTVDPQFMVIEKTGHVEETQLLFEKLRPYGVLEFARSGRVAVTKPMKELSTYLEEI
ncbi:acetolactate synthase small subunit [Oceanihabitans sediminis]|uniref:Acetolactate synthase small subunit n=1 Tax=Oceanihabitans sediminis TaxID=1812012 RepID=A0A368P9I8_9FLAO|nr:acetolactate synthase small subunit [Oceanihabitans sediminis]MDX1772562.1 acetolactate synthase small subunit [Oceanihabitans sediminis]RBP34211.1 acetolactate synthase small subunit [Oceanihabitans sediminis]RCU57901.1 acetolactate synthase small subunit [Oceanihabitans sediminis]